MSHAEPQTDRQETKNALHANQVLMSTVRLIKPIKTKEVRTKISMYNRFMVRWQANPVPLASSILNCETAQMVTPWRQTDLRWDLWEQFVVQPMEAWVMLDVLTYRRLEAAVMEAEADAPMTPATHTISMMG